MLTDNQDVEVQKVWLCFYFSGDGIKQTLGKMFLGLCAMEGFGVLQCIALFSITSTTLPEMYTSNLLQEDSSIAF
jgi:hypothetical protein